MTKTRVRAALSLPLGLFLALTGCSAQDRATGPEEVRELAGSTRARHSREGAEEHLRSVVRAYDEETPLALGLVSLDDTCAGGAAEEWLPSSEDDRYRIRCTVRMTAYYGGDPKRIANALEGVFTAGDREASGGGAAGAIPFGHDEHRERLVAYYEGRGPNPTGPDAPEPAQVSDPSQTLSWDTVRSDPPTRTAEPGRPAASDPPVSRHLREPASTTVADVRAHHGMVFRLELSAVEYYSVSKDGRTVQDWE
ncbi:hypothetical protein OG206_06205 [Streptomyces sp. NBC_01341]|uniref:hypothetical protein n=1 Tax=Streptomyces sp. NBC_01341 TaxID=2903831 RepID=UPI002E148F4F|nr:hypothetical protein OG206_06205 [Streptomyces sp. NBC_01341]